MLLEESNIYLISYEADLFRANLSYRFAEFFLVQSSMR